MNPYKLALLTGTHQHRWATGVCEKCGKIHSPHSYNGNGVCTVCGYICLHPDGWLPDGIVYHKCPVCYKRETHTHNLLSQYDPATQLNACFDCPVCNIHVTEHTWDGGVCSVCGSVRYHLLEGAACYVPDFHSSWWGAYKPKSVIPGSVANGVTLYECWREGWNYPNGPEAGIVFDGQYQPVANTYLAAINLPTPVIMGGITVRCRALVFCEHSDYYSANGLLQGDFYRVWDYREYVDGEPVLTFDRAWQSASPYIFPEIIDLY